MSPELTEALAWYRQWLHATAWAEWCRKRMQDAADTLPGEAQQAEYERLTAEIAKELAD